MSVSKYPDLDAALAGNCIHCLPPEDCVYCNPAYAGAYLHKCEVCFADSGSVINWHTPQEGCLRCKERDARQ